MRRIYAVTLLMAVMNVSYAELINYSLSCRVETEVRNGAAVVTKKSETITVDAVIKDDEFVFGGSGEFTQVFATNSPRMKRASSINDKTTSSRYEVEFLLENEDPNSRQKVYDEVKFRLDRIKGILTVASTWKSIGEKVNFQTTGVCDRASKKF